MVHGGVRVAAQLVGQVRNDPEPAPADPAPVGEGAADVVGAVDRPRLT